MNTHIRARNIRFDPDSMAGSLKIRGAITGKDMTIMLLLIIYSSGNPFMGRVFPIEPQHICLALFFGLLLFRKQRTIVTGNFVGISLMFALILLVQCVSFSFYPVITIMGFFTRLFIGYAVIRLVGDFPYVYVRAMVGLSVLGLVIHLSYHVLALSGIDIQGLIIKLSTALRVAGGGRLPLFVHTFTTSPLRNAGMFGEPGMFAGYLSLAMVFLAMIKDRLSRRAYTYYLIILSIALLTTLSTTGYVVYLLILLLHYGGTMQAKKKISAKIMLTLYIVLPLITAGSFIAYNKLPFLREKISHQMDSAKWEEGNWRVGRLGSLVFDWKYIKRRPFTGWGLHRSTRYSLDPDIIETPEGMGNGFSDFTAAFGITGMLIWLYFVFRAIMHLTKKNLPTSLIAMLVIILLLQGECFLGFPLFLGLMFLCVPRSLPAFSNSHVHRSYYVQT